MDVNPDKLNTFIGKMLGDVGAAMNASLMLIGDKLGLYKTLAAKGPLTSAELAQATRHQRTLCPRMARRPGRIRLCRLRRGVRQILDDAGAGYGVRRRGQPGVHGSGRQSGVGDVPRRTEDLRRVQDRQGRRLEPSAANACSAAPRASSAPATSTIWCRNGCPRLTASSTSSSAAPRSPTSAADTACPRG